MANCKIKNGRSRKKSLTGSLRAKRSTLNMNDLQMELTNISLAPEGERKIGRTYSCLIVQTNTNAIDLLSLVSFEIPKQVRNDTLSFVMLNSFQHLI